LADLHHGSLVGFIDLGDDDISVASLFIDWHLAHMAYWVAHLRVFQRDIIKTITILLAIFFAATGLATLRTSGFIDVWFLGHGIFSLFLALYLCDTMKVTENTQTPAPVNYPGTYGAHVQI